MPIHMHMHIHMCMYIHVYIYIYIYIPQSAGDPPARGLCKPGLWPLAPVDCDKQYKHNKYFFETNASLFEILIKENIGKIILRNDKYFFVTNASLLLNPLAPVDCEWPE